MRCGRRLVAAALVAGGLGFVPARPAGAACPVGALVVEPTSAAAGGVVTVTGQYFGTACNDTLVNGEVKPPLGDPARGIALVVRQDGTDRPLVTIDAAADYSFVVTVALPTDLHDGTATVRTSGARGAPEAALTIAGVGTDPTVAPVVIKGALNDGSTTTVTLPTVGPDAPSGGVSTVVALVTLGAIVGLGAVAAAAVGLRARRRH